MDVPPDHEKPTTTSRDPVTSLFVRRALEALRDRSSSESVRSLLTEILAGRRPLRDIATSPALADEASPLVAEAAERYRNMSDEERTRLLATGAEHLRRIRRRLSDPDRASSE